MMNDEEEGGKLKAESGVRRFTLSLPLSAFRFPLSAFP